MNEKQSNKTVIQKILVGILLLVLVYVFAQIIINKRIDSLATSMRTQISEQQSLVATIAEITARNGADAVTESIVRDCVERVRFDTLLGQLDAGLSWAELNELERLFGRCGSFSAQRKSVMVARLSREVEVYETYVNQLQSVTSESEVAGYSVEKWKRLASEERKQSELFTKLVGQQEDIIDELLLGKNVNSPEITTILAEVKENQETLLVANKQAADLRSELISL